MSEYQYYEFQALDRPLTSHEQAAISNLSSRVELTPRQASFVYNYGSFRSNPHTVLHKYFDAMLYITNWGTRQLMFRFPKGLVQTAELQPYTYPENVTVKADDEYVILNIEFHDEDPQDGWLEGKGMLSGLVALRDDIIQGDLRTLYLAWLMIAFYETEVLEEDEDLTEPPVPPNLHQLSAPLRNFIDFFSIDIDLVSAAAEASSATQESHDDLKKLIPLLSEQERNNFLERLLEGQQHLDTKLTKRLRLLLPEKNSSVPEMPRRTIRDLVEASEGMHERRKLEEKRQAEAARAKKMDALASQEAQLWKQVSDLVERRNPQSYDEAVNILKDLRELARYQNRLSEFQKKMMELQERYPTLRGLHSRMKTAKLL